MNTLNNTLYYAGLTLMAAALIAMLVVALIMASRYRRELRTRQQDC